MSEPAAIQQRYEADYTPFINAQMAKKPEAVFSAMWGGHFVTWAKQAKPVGFFDLVHQLIQRFPAIIHDFCRRLPDRRGSYPHYPAPVRTDKRR